MQGREAFALPSAASGALLLLLAATSCNRIQTPPPQAVAADAPALLAPGENSLDIGIAGSTEVFGAFGVTFNANTRHGLHEVVELQTSLEGTWIEMETSDYEKEHGRAHRGYYAARVGGKVRLFEHMALTAGIGLGHAPAAGSFFGTDFGLILGYENRYVVPYAHGRVYYSLPFATKEIPADWGLEGSGGLPPAYENTFGATAMFGLKIPVAAYRALEGKTMYNLYFAMGPAFVYPKSFFEHDDRGSSSVFVQAQTRFEVVFPSPRARKQAAAAAAAADL